MMKKKSQLAYEKISEEAKFREQYRFLFSTAVIATLFVIPNSDPFETLLKWVLGFSAFFAALFLISSAARLKYSEPGRLYEVFYIGERFRMWAYDWSLHVFAAAFLFFTGIIITGLINMIPGIQITGVWSWVVVIAITFVIAIITLFITNKAVSKKSKKKLPEI